jgi:hypothetical protein
MAIGSSGARQSRGMMGPAHPQSRRLRRNAKIGMSSMLMTSAATSPRKSMLRRHPFSFGGGLILLAVLLPAGWLFR